MPFLKKNSGGDFEAMLSKPVYVPLRKDQLATDLYPGYTIDEKIQLLAYRMSTQEQLLMIGRHVENTNPLQLQAAAVFKSEGVRTLHNEFIFSCLKLRK
jgi:hypothetical protein